MQGGFEFTSEVSLVLTHSALRSGGWRAIQAPSHLHINTHNGGNVNLDERRVDYHNLVQQLEQVASSPFSTRCAYYIRICGRLCG